MSGDSPEPTFPIGIHHFRPVSGVSLYDSVGGGYQFEWSSAHGRE